MRNKQVFWTMLVGVLMLAVTGANPASATPGFYDYGFVIDNTVSSLTVTAMVDPAVSVFGPKTDTATSPLSGTISAYLNPVEGTYSQIQIYETDMVADNPVSMSLSWGDTSGFFATGVDADVNGTDLGLLLGGTEGYGTVGPVTTVGSGGSFTQTGSEVQATGTMVYSIYACFLGGELANMADTLDLIDDSTPKETDFTGTVIDSGDTVTLTLNVDMTINLKDYLVGDYAEYAQYLDSGTVTIEGTVVAYANKPLLGDADADNDVDLDDLGALADNWGTTSDAEWAEGDFDLDGDVDLDDLGALADHWGATASGGPVQAPEPATMSLLGVGALALLRRRK